jgi:PAS domain S-box-containing protein
MGTKMQRSIDRSVLVGCGLVVALLILTALLTYRNTQRLNDDAAWVAHTHEVLDLTAEVLLTLVDAETGQRGFLFTGQDDFLRPYKAAIARLDERLALLRSKTEDNPRQQDRLARLGPMIAAELELLRQGIDLRRQHADQAQLLLAAAKGKGQMDAIRAVVAEMQQEEHDLLTVRQRQTQDAYGVAVTTGIATAVLGLVTVGVCFWLFWRTLRARTQAATALYEQREWFRTTLDSIGDAVIATDAEGRVTFLNGVAGTLTGWGPQEAAGQPLERVFRNVNEETRKPVESPVSKVLRQGVAVGLANHTVLVAKSGQEIPIDDCGAPIRDERGAVAGVVLVFRDVTESRAAIWGRLRLASIVESSDDAILSKTLDGTILSWNQGAERLYGYNAEEVIGKPVSLLTPADHADELPEILKRLKRGEHIGQFETVRVRKDGKLVQVAVSVSLLKNSSDEVVGASVIARDLSERRRADQLAETNRLKDEFLAMLGHELRNPLAPIPNAVQVLEELSPADPDLKWARDVIERQVQHLTRLVDELLDVSRISRGKITLQKERLKLAQVVADAVEIARPHIEARRHKLTVLQPPEPVWLEGDATRLAQVLANLLNNAAKYTERGGHIWLTVEQGGPEALVRVRDTGVGIAPEMLPLVFDLFTQADRSLHRSQGGLGIGLTLVRHLVEMHGGEVRAFSHGLGRGSEFVIRLPVLPGISESGETPEQSAPAPVAPPPRRILIADDNEDFAELTARLLRRRGGHEVKVVYDGPAALEAAPTFRPEAAFLDIGLPGINGYELAQRLRQLPGLEKALLVALTGYGQEEDRRRALAVGFDDHLTKPVGFDRLQRLLAERAVAAGV